MTIRKFAALLLLTIGVSLLSSLAFAAQKAYYYPNADRLFWFMILSDTHIGADNKAAKNTAVENLTWTVGPARQVIQPLFIVNCGDLCDSTNGGTIPNGPYKAEWDQYRQILVDAGMTPDFYYDMPGNHDQYNDKTFSYYLWNSIQGVATGKTQPSWTRQFSYGSYHFLGVCTPGNDGASWSMNPEDNFGDHAGLDEKELDDIEADLKSHTDAQLTLIFGHHPLEPYYINMFDTGLTYGLLPRFLDLIEDYQVPFYGFGHTHEYRENFRTSFYYKTFTTPGLYYMNFASLGKASVVSDDYKYAVMAVDGNGLSLVPAKPGVWPVVMITAPVNRNLGTSPNPYTYEIPQKANNPIRALVFDSKDVTQVQFSIDGSPVWQDMQRIGVTPVWQGYWNASAAAPGAHTIAVRAQGSTLVTDSITTSINPALPRANIAPITTMLLSD
jgi:hypothetical protein